MVSTTATSGTSTALSWCKTWDPKIRTAAHLKAHFGAVNPAVGTSTTFSVTWSVCFGTCSGLHWHSEGIDPGAATCRAVLLVHQLHLWKKNYATAWRRQWQLRPGSKVPALLTGTWRMSSRLSTSAPESASPGWNKEKARGCQACGTSMIRSSYTTCGTWSICHHLHGLWQMPKSERRMLPSETSTSFSTYSIWCLITSLSM